MSHLWEKAVASHPSSEISQERSQPPQRFKNTRAQAQVAEHFTTNAQRSQILELAVGHLVHILHRAEQKENALQSQRSKKGNTAG